MCGEGLTKLIDVGSFWDSSDVPMSLIEIDDTSHGHLKVAADSSIQEFVDKSMKIDPDYTYLHINAMGAGEYYGSNKNGDYFPEEQLKKYCKTFETDGYVYRHHINKDPNKSLGRVIFATYNDRMHRVELIAQVSKKLGQDIEDNIAAGMFPQTSMGCKTPYDICSICGNQAHTRAQYCEHISQGVNRVLPDGRKVMAINLGPLRFFDISIVLRPADITSSVLAKVASEAAVLSTDMAEAEELVYNGELTKAAETIKEAALSKMSELVKRVEGEVVGVSNEVQDIIEKIQDPHMDIIPTLSRFPISDTLNAFAELGMAPSVKFLAELFAYKMLGEKALGVGEKAEQVTLMAPPSTINVSKALEILEMEPIVEGPANSIILNLLRNSSDSSLFEKDIEKRAQVYQGYLSAPSANALPKYVSMSPEEVEAKRAELMAQAQSSGSVFKTLLALGGAAILGRMYVSSLVDKKVEAAKKDILISQYLDSRAKIDFEKTASFASAMIDSITNEYYHLTKR